MPNPQTTYLKQEKPIANQESLDLLMASRVDEYDLALGGYPELSLSGLSGNQPLAVATHARAATIRLKDNPSAAVTIQIPHNTGALAEITFINDCGGSFSTVTIKSTGTNSDNAAGVSIPTGKTLKVRHNGNSAFPTGSRVDSSTGVVDPSTLSTIWARAYHSAAQTLADGTLTALALNSERWDTDAIHDNASNNSRLTCKTAGVYSISGAVEFDANAVGTRLLGIKLNNTTYLAIQTAPAAPGGLTTRLVIETKYLLAVNDYLELIVYQNSGGLLNVASGANYSPEFMMVRLGS